MASKVKVYSDNNLSMVGSLQNYLLQHDIQAEIRNQYAGGVLGELPLDIWPELWVSEHDTLEARQLLDQVANSHTAESVGPDWLCKYCRESNPGNFELCWQCAKPT